MRRVWVLGSLNIDTTYQVKSIPKPGQTIIAQSSKTNTGGKGANQAYACTYWGGKVSVIGVLGNDANGDLLLKQLQTSGVDTRYIERTQTESGTAIIYVDSQGSNCIVVNPGANQKIKIDENIEFRKGDILVAQLEVNIDAVEQYFALARRKDVTTILNPSPYKPIPSEVLNHTNIIVANEDEAQGLSGVRVIDVETANKSAQKIISLGPNVVIITLGCKGVLLYTNKKHYISGHTVEAVDTQGAGDAFLGSYVYKIAMNEDQPKAAEFSNAAAALSVTKKGSTQVSMPTMDEVEMLIGNLK